MFHRVFIVAVGILILVSDARADNASPADIILKNKTMTLPSDIQQKLNTPDRDCFAKVTKTLGPDIQVSTEQMDSEIVLPEDEDPYRDYALKVYPAPDIHDEITTGLEPFEIVKNEKSLWAQVVCEAALTPDFMIWMQERLAANGHYLGVRHARDGQVHLDKPFYKALTAYQKQQNLFHGGLTYETILSLNQITPQ